MTHKPLLVAQLCGGGLRLWRHTNKKGEMRYSGWKRKLLRLGET